MLKLTFEDIVSCRARIQTRFNLQYSTYQNSVNISLTIYVIRDVIFLVSGDIFAAVLYTIEHSTRDCHQLIGDLSFLSSTCFSFPLSTHKERENIYIVVHVLPNSKNGTLLKLTWLAGSPFMW